MLVVEEGGALSRAGLINLDEFKLMLDMIGIKMTTAKALKYFKMCDVDDSGEIDFEEFKVALRRPFDGRVLEFR